MMKIRIGFVLLLGLLPCVAVNGANDYLTVVRAYADAVLDHGRDTYGTVHSPLWAAAMDRKSLKLLEGPPGEIPGIREGDRSLHGANPMHDLNLYQVLYGLTRLTGDKRYAAAADESLKWFLDRTQSPETGLFPWGEHLSWNFLTEKPDAPQGGRDWHEFYRPWVLMDRCFTLSPDAMQRFARGLWDHQIYDHETGEFSRHARYATHGPQRENEYPRHGGFYIATWAAAYQRSKQPEFLKAIEVLVSSYEKRKNPKTGAIPAQSSYPDLMWPSSNVSLAIDLTEGALKVPGPLAQKMRSLANSTDSIFLGMKHDFSAKGRGFIQVAITSTWEPGAVRGGNQHFSRIWATGYGDATDAQTAMLCLLRYRQTKLDGYRKLFLAATDRYRTSEPDRSIALYPGALGDAIAVLLEAYRLTRDKTYLERADRFGQEAVEIFFSGSPLPKASSQHEHYEAITRGDTLAMVLLDLWDVKNRPKIQLNLIWSDR